MSKPLCILNGMNFDKFLIENKIGLLPNIKSMCLIGLEELGASKDPNHDVIHVNTMLADLAAYLKGDIRKNPDFNVLLPAIIFHDLWYSRKKQTRNLFVFIFRIFYEGFGSVICTDRYLKEFNVSKKLSKKIKRAIFVHIRTGLSVFDKTFLEARFYEEKILCDLDQLNQFNLSRIKHITEYYLKDKLKKTDFFIVLVYFKLFISKSNANKYYLDHFVRQSEALMPKAHKYFLKIYREIYNNPHKYFKNPRNYKLFLFIAPDKLYSLLSRHKLLIKC